MFLPGSSRVTDAMCTLTTATQSQQSSDMSKRREVSERSCAHSFGCTHTVKHTKPSQKCNTAHAAQMSQEDFAKRPELLLRGGGGKQNQSKEQRLLVGLQTLLQVMDEDSEDDSAENDGEIKLLLQLKDLIKYYKKGSLLQLLKSVITQAT